jgi:1-acyl-sn-glycerol-3-phosphate acyltransferase
MAIEAGVPLIPVVVWGGHRVWTTGRKPVLRRGVPVVIEVAPPLELTPDTSAAELTSALHEAMTSMCEKVQGAYPPPLSDDEQWWQPAYLGGAAPTLEEAKTIEAAALAARAARKAAKNKGKR